MSAQGNRETAFDNDAQPLAKRLGLLIPAVNSQSEPQFNKYAPQGVSIHVMRERISPREGVDPAQLKDMVRNASAILRDVDPDLIVFHCTASSMKDGPEGDAALVGLVQESTQKPACSTIGLVLEAMQALGMKRVVILSPYPTNADAVNYLAARGIETVHDVALNMASGADFPKLPASGWADLAAENDRPEADGFFLSCTNTTQIDAIADIEARTGKPVVNSNQAVLWGAARRLGAPAGVLSPALGRLARTG